MPISRRRPWMLPLIVAALTVAIAVGVLFEEFTRDRGSDASSATLPTACENFTQASELFAQGGSAQALAMTGGHVFTRDTQADSKQILRDLMDSCDAERMRR